MNKTNKDLLKDLQFANTTAEQLRKENKELREWADKTISDKDVLISMYQTRNVEQNEKAMAFENKAREIHSQSGRNLRTISDLL